MSKPCTSLLIDGRNILYRSVYAGKGDEKFKQSGNDYFTIILRMLNKYLTTFKPNSAHIFWDDKSGEVWRNDIYKDYKKTRDNSDISELINRQFKLSLDIFRFLGLKQYYRKRQEADDLIYAFCRSFKEPMVIVSSDSDLNQIPYYMNHVSMHNPSGAAIKENTMDPIILKSLIGDKTDNILGYYRIGKVKGAHYATNLYDRIKFIEQAGVETLRLNRMLIDLGLCPYLLDNMLYVEKQRSVPTKYDYKQAVIKMREYGISGGITELERCIHNFSRLC